MSGGSRENLVPVGLATLATAVAMGGAAVKTMTGKASSRRALDSQVSAASGARFLTQCTFGPTDASIADVQSAGFAGWITNQLSMAPWGSHLAFVRQRLATLKGLPGKLYSALYFHESFWQQTVTAPDQLRQRVKLALSEIFVISLANLQIAGLITGASSYYDMLGRNAFGNFRDLLEQVTLHPMMGVYLTYLANLPANAATGQHPDENYAREVMQLMTIGLYQLDQDGTVRTDGSGAPIPTYSHDDIAGLAAVFTGFSWYSDAPVSTGTRQTFYPITNGGLPTDPKAPITPMLAYPLYHQTTAKSFLGVTIPASAAPDPTGELKIALDTLFNHANVGPFIGKQLIQRLVTSNPSPDYVSRVAAVFNDDGTGVRGNLAAVVQAILLDQEARDDTVSTSPTFGKIREPVVRLASWARAFNASSTSGTWFIPSTSSPTALDQSALTSPSVFNFWAPGYSPPGTATNSLGLVAPEFQAVDEVSVAGYLNFMLSVITSGAGSKPPGSNSPDVRSGYAMELSLAANAADLVGRLNLLLMSGQMSAGLQATIVGAVNAIPLPAPAAALKDALLRRVQTAVFMTFASPEFLVQR